MSLPSKPPTKKQITFAKHYVSNGFVAKHAALAAGYSDHVASRGLNMIKNNKGLKNTIEASIDRVREQAFDEIGAGFKARVQLLWRIALDIIDEHNQIRRGFTRNAIAAIAELNRMSGDYAPDRSLRLNVTMTKDKMLEAKKAYEDF